jgi:hypothetical protein
MKAYININQKALAENYTAKNQKHLDYLKGDLTIETLLSELSQNIKGNKPHPISYIL